MTKKVSRRDYLTYLLSGLIMLVISNFLLLIIAEYWSTSSQLSNLLGMMLVSGLMTLGLTYLLTAIAGVNLRLHEFSLNEGRLTELRELWTWRKLSMNDGEFRRMERAFVKALKAYRAGRTIFRQMLKLATIVTGISGVISLLTIISQL